MRVLVISDQPLTVFALRGVLLQCDPDATVDDAAYLAEAMELLTLSHRDPIDLILLDLDTHGMRRIHGATLLRQMWPDIPLAVISATEPDLDVVHAIDIGAMGYLLKTADTDTLVNALRHVMTGGIYLPEMDTLRLGWSALE